jgi:hypothetical protein
MYKNVLNHYTIAIIVCFSLCVSQASAQFTISGQLRSRGELRDGYGTLETDGNKDAAFISQRTRLIFNYQNSKIIFHTSLQDIRLWGQDASTISSTDGSKLELHEAWAEIILSNKKDRAFKSSPFDYFAIKLGRQEISYDDERLLGSLDWTQQGRRHDAIIMKMIQDGWKIDLGAAFNQNTDAINYNGTYYTPANVPTTIKDSKGNLVNTPAGFIPLINSAGVSAKNGSPVFANSPGTSGATQDYKSMQFLHIEKQIGGTHIAGLFLTDQFSKYKLDSVENVSGTDVGYIYGQHFNQSGVNTRYTTGLLVNEVFGADKEWSFNGEYYYQGGHDRIGLDLSAYTSSLALAYKLRSLLFTGGWDYLSGNNSFSTSTTDHRFDPLYGTPHKFWGYMDYFYAVSGAPLGGLSNPYFKVKYTTDNKRFFVEIDNHYFFLGNNQKTATSAAVSKYLGSEFDMTADYKLNKVTSVDLGLSYMAATQSMEYAKNITPGTAKLNPVWAYLQINIKPQFLNK